MKWTTYILVFCIFSLVFSHLMFADSSVTFTATGTARFTFSGHIAPNSIITFLEHDVSVGTTVSDSTGFFSKDIDETDNLPHTISYYFTDAAGNISPTFTQVLSTNINNQIITPNIIMPPTIHVSQTSVTSADQIALSGYTFPSAPVTVTIHSGTITKTTTSDTNGNWNITLVALDIGSGDHTVSAVAAEGTTISSASTSIAFTISQTSSSSTSTSSSGSSSTGGSSSNTTLSSPASTGIHAPTKPTEYFLPGDFDHDGKVDEIDLGMFLSHFNQIVTGFTEMFDLNHSGRIGIRDFSILLYFWGR